MILSRSILVFVLMVLALPLGAWGANTHGTQSEAQERQAWGGDALPSYAAAGCLPTVPGASLTVPAFACAGYVRETNNQLTYTSQGAITVGPLNAGNGTYWLALHADTSTTVASWTRQPGTHYLWRLNATKPATPARSMIVSEVTVAAGAISAVTEHGHRVITGTLTLGASAYAVSSTATWVVAPGGQIAVGAGVVTINGCLQAADTEQIFTGTLTNLRLQGCAATRVVPQWFGANGGDTTDDLAALQAWAASVITTGGHLYLPGGTYLYSSTVSVYDNTHLECAGNGLAVFKNNGTTQNFLTLGDTANSHNITIENCSFDANGYNVVDFLDFISFNSGTNVSSDIRVRNNHFYDSAYVGDATVKQRQYIVMIGCFDCWIQGNHLEQGGRIKVGRPGGRFWIVNNEINFVNDNGITIVDTQLAAITEEVIITGNLIRNMVSSGIYLGADGQAEPDTMTLRKITIQNNIIVGDWGGSCMQLTGSTTTQDIQILDNQCILEGMTRVPQVGISLTRQDISVTAAENVTVARNTLVRRNGATYAIADMNISSAGAGFTDLHILDNVMPEGVMRFSGASNILLRPRIINNRLARLTLANNPTMTDVRIVDNMLIANSASPMMEFTTTNVVSGLISGNQILRSGAGEAIAFAGVATHTVDVIYNTFTPAAMDSLKFLGGAVHATTALNLWNKGNTVVNAIPVRHLIATATWDPGNLAADGDATSVSVTLAEAVVGSPCSASHTQLTDQRFLLSAHVPTGGGTVRVSLMNKTGGALDIASGTLTVTCWQY